MRFFFSIPLVSLWDDFTIYFTWIMPYWCCLMVFRKISWEVVCHVYDSNHLYQLTFFIAIMKIGRSHSLLLSNLGVGWVQHWTKSLSTLFLHFFTLSRICFRSVVVLCSFSIGGEIDLIFLPYLIICNYNFNFSGSIISLHTWMLLDIRYWRTWIL